MSYINMYGGVHWIEFEQGKVVLNAIVNRRISKSKEYFNRLVLC